MKTKIEEFFNLDFNNKSLLETALSHSSYKNEKGGEDYERLEFIGDGVINLLIAEYLYKTMTDQEGALSKHRANIVCEKSLAHCARLSGMDKEIRLGKGEEKTGGRNKDAILCDVFEAVLGAVYFDKGLDECRKIVDKIVIPNIEYAYSETVDYKSILQEYLQGEKRSLKYELYKQSGAAHDKTFIVRVIMDDNIVLGEGKGKSHQDAEMDAARKALDKLAK